MPDEEDAISWSKGGAFGELAFGQRSRGLTKVGAEFQKMAPRAHEGCEG